jgi:tetratricopeptide (TPR) repeat protein
MKQVQVCFVLLMFVFPASGCGDSDKGVPEAAVNHFIAASKAIADGDREAALRELTASIEQKPTAWAYYQRAKVLLDGGQESEAADDCVKGLELEPDHRDLKWFAGELKKPAAKRFRGRYKNPPSASK